ncbi:MAG: hypothetical protein DHS20C21_03490 [Gemmatimonadota bacterium]|nr:MAG: hypothetical protein DHS20C21_03490 [Gemmatimonadota bacterium]
MTGGDLDALVAAIRDPRRYSWRDAWACLPCTEPPLPPQLGVVFYAGDTQLTLVSTPRFMNLVFTEPWAVSLTAVGAIFDPGVLSQLGRSEFPEIEWDAVRPFGLSEDPYWLPGPIWPN